MYTRVYVPRVKSIHKHAKLSFTFVYKRYTHTTLIILPIFNIVLIGNGTIINVALLTWHHDEAISNVQYTDLVTIYEGVLV